MTTRFKQDNPGCDCCGPTGPCCTAYIGGAAAAGITGATGTVSGSIFSLSTSTGAMNTLCGWTSTTYDCKPLGSDVVLPVSPCVYYSPSSTLPSANCPSSPANIEYGSVSAGAGVACAPDGSPLWGGSVQASYSIAYYFCSLTNPISFGLISAGYTQDPMNLNRWIRTEGDPNSGLYKSSQFIRIPTSPERWNITNFMQFVDPSPSVVAFYIFPTWTPWFDPIGSTLSGAIT